MATTKQIFRKIGRVFLYILLGIFTLVLALLIFINIPAGKKVVRNQVQAYLQKKLKTKVSIGYIDYSLPKWLEIQNVYIEDQKKDTLLFGEKLSVDLNMFKLIRGNTDIQKVVLKNIFVNINRPETDSNFNYQFIIDAFSGNKSSTPNTDTSEMKLSLDRLIFENVGLVFNDKFGGNEFGAKIRNLDITTKKFQPDRLNFGIDNFYANGVDFFMKTTKASVPEITPENVDSVVAKTYGLYISANKLNLRDVVVHVENKITGLFYSNNITHLGITNALFSIDQSIGTADSLLLDSSTIVFTQPKKLDSIIVVDSSAAPAAPWLFSAANFNVRNSFIKYDNANLPAAEGLDFAHLDIKNLNAAVSQFKFSKDTTRATISQFAFADKSGFQLDTTQLKFIFTDTLLAATDIYIKTPNSVIQRSFNLRFDSVAAIQTAPQNSLVNAVLNNTVIGFNDLYLLVPALKQSLPPAQFMNQSLSLNTELRGNLQRLYIPYLQLSGLSGTRIAARGAVYNLTDPNKLSYDLYIDESNFYKRDLLKFVPPANQQQMANLPDVFNLQGHFAGNMNELTADLATNASNFGFNGRIAVQNIKDPTKLQFSTNISQAYVDRGLIVGFMPPEALAQISLPQRITASGKLSGNTDNIDADMKVGSNYGPVNIKGFVKNIKDPQRANYDLVITTPGFAVGTLIKQDSILGTVAGTFYAKGTGFDYKTMRSVIKADVNSLQYNQYTYRNALINAQLNNGIINSTGSVNDSNLVFNYALAANVKGAYPTIDGVFDIDTARLQQLNLYDTALDISGKATVKANSLQPRSLDASLLLDTFRIRMGDKAYVLDTTSLIATSANGIDSINFFAPFAQVTASGAFDYDKIGPSIQQYIGRYYKFPNQPVGQNLPDQQISFAGKISKTSLLTDLVPGLYDYADINFSGNYNSNFTDSALNLTATLPRLVYQTTRLSNAAINVGSSADRLNYEIKFDTLNNAGTVFYGTNINGAAANDSVSLNATTKDNKNTDWFGLSGSAYVNDDTYSFRLRDNLLLNYERWNVANDNYVSYSPQGIIVNNFLISSDTAKIFIKSRELVNNSPIDIDIDNFNLKSISSLTSGDTLFAAGILDVKASVSELDKALPAFTGKASISDLQIMQYPLGNMTAFAEKQSENNIVADVALKGNGNDIDVKGNYYLNNEQQQFDATADIRQLSFKTLQAFSGGALENSSGNIKGNIVIDGKFTDPRWKGQIEFDTTKFTIAQLGTPYRINNQKITLDHPRVSFPAFTILDSANHKMVINGFVDAKTFTQLGLGIDINAADFILVNARKKVNNQLYGYAAVDVNVSIDGTSTAPNIEGDIYLNDKSDLYMVLPEKSYSNDEGKTIVRFIDMDTFRLNPPVVFFEEAKEEAPAFGKFLNYNLNIEVTKEAKLTVIIDPVTGDEVQVQGDAQLNAGVDPGGNIVLAGNYELDKGYYILHYQFLERKFDLVKGSTITFAGDPLDAKINITAQYTALTSPKDLLSNEVSGLSPSLANAYNQKLPFAVVLYLTGQLSKPTIKFDITLPENSGVPINGEMLSTVETKLTQLRGDEAATNKQVFSLLLLNRFVGEQSSDFFKGNGSGFDDLARQSVSQFLSSALNQIAGDLFKGIDVDLNLNSYNDYSTGNTQQRTDLNVAVSKSFLDERLTVTVGSNFGLQGQDAATKASGQNTGFKPDISLAYKLTSDGKYRVRAYTKNAYEVTVDGYVVENGLGFVITMDYDKFRELFQRKKFKP